MKKKIITAAFIIVSISAINKTIAQDKSSEEVKIILTADSLASGNTKDVLTGFFQLAFDNLIGDNKELNFSSNPYAVMLKSNPAAALDYNYYKYRALRKLNFNFGLKLDTLYHFNGFSSGIKYALIDKRDSTTSKLLFGKLINDKLSKEADHLQEQLDDYAKTIKDTAQKKQFRHAERSFFNDEISFDQLDTFFQRAVKAIVNDDTLTYTILSKKLQNNLYIYALENDKFFDSLKNLIKNSLLWTAGISDTTNKDRFFFSNILLSTELVTGFGPSRPGSNIELDAKAGLNFRNDSLSARPDLKRSIFNFEPGFNFVFRDKTNDKSLAEIELSGSYNHILSGKFNSEKKDSIAINGTFRIRIINDIWIPLEIKYDPENGNVFGALNVRVNFTALRNFFNQKNKY